MPAMSYATKANRRTMNTKNAILAAAACLAGCANLDHSLPTGASVPAGESVVFGAVYVSSRVTGFLVGSGSITVIDESSSRTVLTHEIRKLGAPFYWHLPPGKYAIMDLQEKHLSPRSSTRSKRIYAQFSVDLPSQPVYVGKLLIAAGKNDLSVTVTDDYDKAVRTLYEDYPKFNAV